LAEACLVAAEDTLEDAHPEPRTLAELVALAERTAQQGLRNKPLSARVESWKREILERQKEIQPKEPLPAWVRKWNAELRRVKPLVDLDFISFPPAREPTKDKDPELGEEYGRRYQRSPGGTWWYNQAEGEYPVPFACQARGRFTGPHGDGWCLYLINKDDTWSFWVRLDSQGLLYIFTGHPFRGAPVPGPVIKNTALRGHGQFNDVRLVVRGRHVELAVNGTPVGQRVLLDRDFPRYVRVLLGINGEPDSQADYQRLTIWPVAE
jgi:hypothetical protein